MSRWLVGVVEGFKAEIDSTCAELFFNAEQLVVLGDAVSAADGAGFDLTYACGHRKISDESVFRFAGAVRHDGGIAVAAAEIDGFEGLGERADLVDLDENGIGCTLFNAALQALDVGDEKIIA